MKICAVSDLHGHTFDIPKCDIFILAGDISWDGNYIWYKDVFCDWLKSYKDNYNVCILVFGNHDDNIYMDRTEEELYSNLPENVVILNNENYTYKNIKFFGSPNCRYIHGFRNTLTENVLEVLFNKMDKGTDILITHSPPYGIGDIPKGNIKHLGSRSLFKKVEEVEPKFHFFGHIHSGVKHTILNKTNFYNVSVVDENYELSYPITCIYYHK